ncbi:MAG TPA: class I SAM-dependent methyltransferase [Candidatus Dormibacteraeota bacterium]|nr:class I SAM-dependent methyltransferase [Candidatus Dormibacteraeota bacterium]
MIESRRTGAAAEIWRLALEGWKIPAEILAAAPASPWQFPPGLFERRAELALKQATPSHELALSWLPFDGTVLDVGCGPGAASMPLAGRARQLAGVDESSHFLAEFRRLAEPLVDSVVTVQGRWPDVAPGVGPADVVVCANVAYNVTDLAAFARALTEHARGRVVLELTARHPMSELNDLWMTFHGWRGPERPTAGDCADVLFELGLEPHRTDWVSTVSQPPLEWPQMVAWTRRRLCLPADRDAEVEAAIAPWFKEDGSPAMAPRAMVTLDWPGGATVAV